MELGMELVELCQKQAEQKAREKHVLDYIARCKRNRILDKAKEIATTTALGILVLAMFCAIGILVGTPELQAELRETLATEFVME